MRIPYIFIVIKIKKLKIRKAVLKKRKKLIKISKYKIKGGFFKISLIGYQILQV